MTAPSPTFETVRDVPLDPRPSPTFETVRDVPLDPRPSPTFETVRGTPVVNRVLGAILGRAHGKSPAGVAIEVDGVLQASRQPAINLLQIMPGAAGETPFTFNVAEDVPNGANDVQARFDGMRVLSTTGPIDGTVVATHNLFTVPGGEEALVELVVVRCLAASGITGPPSARVGFNAGVDNIHPTQILTGLTAAGKLYFFPPGGVMPVAPAASVISLAISAGAPGGGSMTLVVDLLGQSS